MENKHCVYQIIDNNNTPFYIGKTNNFHRRKMEHLCVLKKGKKGKTWPVYNKIRKLIKEEKYELKMEILKSDLNYDEANKLEIKYIKEYKENGVKLYNLTAGGDGTLNYKPFFTAEWKQKLKDAKSGENWKGENNPFYGKKHSKKTKEKISKAHKGKQTGDQNPFYGKKHSDEVIKKISDTAKKTFSGIPKTEEHKKKISEAHKGKKQSKEHLEKNRLKSCIPYKVTILKNRECFNWNRGLPELSKFLLENYKIKISSGGICNSVLAKRSTKHVLVEKLSTNFN